MIKFIRNLVILFLIAAAVIVPVNALYMCGNPMGVNKFTSVPDTIQVCNFGSSHGNAGFQYADFTDRYHCFNFALGSQPLSYDYRVFLNYESRIGQGTVVFIPVSYFSFFGTDITTRNGFLSLNKRYYKILPDSLILNFDANTAFYVRYFPALAADTKTLVQTLLARLKPSKSNNQVVRANSEDMPQHAMGRYRGHIVADRYDENGVRIVNQMELSALYGLIEACQAKGAIPVLITTPYLHDYTDLVKQNDGFFDEFYGIIRQVTEKTGVEYCDYAFDDRFTHAYDLFEDSDHLNTEGGKVFTDIVMKEIVFAKGYL